MNRILWTLVVLASLQRIDNTSGAVPPVQGGLKRDRSSLLALKNSVSRLGTSKLGVWKSKGNPCWPRAWPHLTCKLYQTSDGRYYSRVHSLEIANSSVVGSLPTALGRLSALQSLNLEGNMFVGTIPTKWGSRLMFRGLRELVLRRNQLTGTLPSNWNVRRGWRRLRTLDLSKNKLVGGLPSAWLGTRKTFRNLQELDLSENRLGLQSDGSTPFPTSEASNGWCVPGTGTESWCPPGPTFSPRDSKMPNLVSLDISNNQLQGPLPSLWGYIFPSLQFLMVHSNSLFVNTEDVVEALPPSWTKWTVPQAFRNLEMLVMWPGNDYVCNLPDPRRSGMRFKETNGAAEYAMADSTYEEFDSTGPWRCPGPADHFPPTDPGTAMVTFASSTNEVILKWRAPSPDPSSSIYGYKVFLTGTDPDQGVIPGFWGTFYLTYNGAALPSDLAESSGVYTLSTGVLADSTLPNYPAGTYEMSVQTVYLDGRVSDALTASGTTSIFPAINAQSANLNTAGTSLTFGWNLASALPTGGSFTWTISRWRLGGTKYTSVDSGTESSPSLPESVSAAVSLSPATHDRDSYRMVVAGKAPLHQTAYSTWWAIAKYNSGTTTWSAVFSTAGPLLAPPSLESATNNAGNLTMGVSLENDAPNRAELSYRVVRQGDSAVMKGTTTVTTVFGQLSTIWADISGSANPSTFDVELSVTANWFTDSETATFAVTVNNGIASIVT